MAYITQLPSVTTELHNSQCKFVKNKQNQACQKTTADHNWENNRLPDYILP